MKRLDKEPRYNLWYYGSLLLENGTWKQVEAKMGEYCIHKDDADIELVDGDLE